LLFLFKLVMESSFGLRSLQFAIRQSDGKTLLPVFVLLYLFSSYINRSFGLFCLITKSHKRQKAFHYRWNAFCLFYLRLPSCG
ncbi:hypothetical protein, partial [uncultured Duncaniella sp.]